MTALQKDPHSRFGTVSAFANALEQASQSRPRPVVVSTAMPVAEPTIYSSPKVAPPTISQPIALAGK